MHAAGAVALLAEENAQLEAAGTSRCASCGVPARASPAAGDLERRALERDLHDGAQQQLTAVLLKLGLVRELVPGESFLRTAPARASRTTSSGRWRNCGGLVTGSILTARRRRSAGALGAVAQRSGGAITFSATASAAFRSELESAVYFCCLEALQNASKHAGAGARISIRLQATDRLLLFQVSDDGVGFDRVPAHDGVGLRNMRDRVDAFDGRLEITSARGRGTAISGALPIA